MAEAPVAEAPVAEAEPASVSEVALVSEVSEVALVVAEAEASVAEAEASVAEAEASVVAEVSPVVPPDEEVSPVVAGASVRVRRRASKTIWCFWLKGSPVYQIFGDITATMRPPSSGEMGSMLNRFSMKPA